MQDSNHQPPDSQSADRQTPSLSDVRPGGAVALGPVQLPWVALATLITLALVGASWRVLWGGATFLAFTAHVAAAVGLSWGVLVYAARRYYCEHNRLTARQPFIVAGQYFTLATCLYAVLINAYFIIQQFVLALVHTYSYTILEPSQWIYSDASGLIDLVCVAAVCLLITQVTQSAYLMVPLFWIFFLALLWQCLMIPPVVRWHDILASNLTGIPSLWVLVLLVGSAFLVSSFVALQGLSWRSSRQKAWKLDVAYLLRPARSWPGLVSSVGGLGVFVLVVGCALLVFPAPAGAFRTVLPALICAAAACITAIAVFTVLHHHWSDHLGELGFALLALSLCSVAMVFVPAEPVKLSWRFPMIFNALIFSCSVCSAHWLWLARIWEQQLFEGRAWTTTGRLIVVAYRCSPIVSAFGVLFSLHMSIWPLFAHAGHDDNTWGRVVCGVAAIALLGVVMGRNYLKTGHPVFRLLLFLNTTALFLFGAVRILPLTGWSY